jgi:uncharacterized protein (TIGR00730 family)
MTDSELPAIRRLCVYCGSHPGTSPLYLEAAQALGKSLVRRKIGLVYGGGNVGLMGAVADSVLSEGGEVIGIIPHALEEKELGHRGCTRLEIVGSMHERKQRMAELADGFIALPGGIGTLEELFEVFTWLQLGFQKKPVAVLNIGGFYDHLLTFLQHVSGEGFLRPEHLACLLTDTDGERLLDQLVRFEVPELSKWYERRLLMNEL